MTSFKQVNLQTNNQVKRIINCSSPVPKIYYPGRMEALGNAKAVLIDCDGVLWRGREAIEGAKEFLTYLKSAGKKVTQGCFVYL